MDIHSTGKIQYQNTINNNSSSVKNFCGNKFLYDVNYTKTLNPVELYTRAMLNKSDVELFKEKMMSIKYNSDIPDSPRKYTDDQVLELVNMYRRNPDVLSKYVEIMHKDFAVTNILISLYKERENSSEEFDFVKKLANKTTYKDGKAQTPYNGVNVYNLLKIHTYLDKDLANKLAEQMAEKPDDKTINIYGVLKSLRDRVGSKEEFYKYIDTDNVYEISERMLLNYKHLKNMLKQNNPKTEDNECACINLSLMRLFNKDSYRCISNSTVFDDLVAGDINIKLLSDLKFNEKIDDPAYLEKLVQEKKELLKDEILINPKLNGYNLDTLNKLVDMVKDPYKSTEIINTVLHARNKSVMQYTINNYITSFFNDFEPAKASFDKFAQNKAVQDVISCANKYPDETRRIIKQADPQNPVLANEMIKTIASSNIPEEYLDLIIDNFKNSGNLKRTNDIINNIICVLNDIEPNEKEYLSIVGILNSKDISNSSEIESMKKGDITQLKIDNVIYTFDGNNNITKESDKCMCDARIFSTKKNSMHEIDYNAHLKDRQHIISSIKKVKDMNGNHIYTEYYIPSKTIKNKFEIWRKDSSGKNLISLAEMSENGTKNIEKSLISIDGNINTQYVYMEDKDCNRLVYMTVIDKAGNVLLKNKQKFRKIDETHFKSEENGVKYDIQYYKEKVICKNENTGEEVEIPIGADKIINTNMVELCKKLSGSCYFMIKHGGLTKIDDQHSEEDNASYNPTNNGIHFGINHILPNNEFTLFHEFGHYKDYKKYQDTKISDDEKLNCIYKEERAELLKKGTAQEIKLVDYFINPKNGADEQRPLREIVAESNAFLYGSNNSDYLENRGDYLFQYFPRTMAYAMSKLI